jgi:hypothetical protein
VLGAGDEPNVRSLRGSRVIPHWQRLAAVAALDAREGHLSAVQRLALVDAAAWWLSEPNGGVLRGYRTNGFVRMRWMGFSLDQTVQVHRIHLPGRFFTCQ